MPSRSLSAAEAAARLGVKRESLYAYVSRGVLSRRVGADGRSSVFDAAEVERLLGQRRRGRPPSVSIDLTITTGLTRITDAGVWYRGVPVHELAGHRSFEQVAAWLWSGADRPEAEPWPSVRGLAAPVEGGRRIDSLLAITAAVAASDRDRRPEQAEAAGRRLIAAFADRVPPPPGRRVGRPIDRSIAARLVARLGASIDDAELVPLVDALLVTVADHELASSTLAARVAASTRADAYGVVAAGLGVLAGPLHGAASVEAHRFLAECRDSGVPSTVDAWLRAGRRVPGFGHKVYRDVDPRYALLVEALRAAGGRSGLRDVVRVLDAAADEVVGRVGVHPNVDLAIGGLLLGAGLAPDTGEVLFAVARTAGWIAHAIEEYDEAPVRFRPRSVYVGPLPNAERGPERR